MDSLSLAIVLLILIFALFAALTYIFFSLLSVKKKLREEIRRMFNAKESGEDLVFKYRGYDIVATFRPQVKISILHDKNVAGIKAPKGATLTPMYLIFKIKKAEEIVPKLDKYIDFLDSIPTQ